MAATRKPSELTAHPRLGPGGVLPPLTSEEYAGLKESIKTDGIMQPLVVTLPELVVIDGHHRLRIAVELGMEEVPVMYREVGNHASDFRLGLSLNLDRRHFTGEQKREAARVVLKDAPDQTNSAVAKAVGLSDKTVDVIRADMVAHSEIPSVEVRRDTKGRKRPAHPAVPRPKRKKAPEPESADEITAALFRKKPIPDVVLEDHGSGSKAPSASERAGSMPAAGGQLTEADGGVSTPPVTTDTEASSEVPGGAEPRASSAEGAAVVFVRSLPIRSEIPGRESVITLPGEDEVEGMTETDLARVRDLQGWCARVIANYARRNLHVS